MMKAAKNRNETKNTKQCSRLWGDAKTRVSCRNYRLSEQNISGASGILRRMKSVLPEFHLRHPRRISYPCFSCTDQTIASVPTSNVVCTLLPRLFNKALTFAEIRERRDAEPSPEGLHNRMLAFRASEIVQVTEARE